jgi:16S rRNA (adenine1518-N6/adenine1519-N6)-dimethyltransferase
MSYSNEILSPSGIIGVLKENDFSLKQRYGQNLLVNAHIASRIIETLRLRKADTVLEIGPGLGALTFLIAERVRKVFAYEVDRGFAKLLEKKRDQLGYGNIKVIAKDFLKADLGRLKQSGSPTKVVSNFPYNIAVSSIIKCIEALDDVERITGTVQEEIAQRLAAKKGAKNYSAVSVYIQYMAEIVVPMRNISPSNFFPKPEVYSAVIDVIPSRKTFPVKPDFFKRVVQCGFSARRKSLVNNLSSLENGLERGRLRAVIREIFNDDKVRAENLSVADFITLCQKLTPIL